MLKQKVVILGGGVGGIMAANHLAEVLPNEIEIVLIEKNTTHSFAASYLWLMVNKRSKEQITASIRDLVDRRVNIISDTIVGIDPENKIISTNNLEVNFDYLVVSLGADMDKTYLDKQQSGIHNFYTLDGAQQLNHALQNFKGGKIAIAVSSLPYKCPGAPYEAAMLINDFLSRKLKKNFSVELYTPEPHPLPVAGPDLGSAVGDILSQKGILFHPLSQLSDIKVDEKSIELADGNSVSYDMLVLIPAHKAPSVIADSNLADESGWIPVDMNTLETKFENIFAIGDVTSVAIPGRWHPDKPMKLPKAGVFAHSQALTVSSIIASKILGHENIDAFGGDGFCMLEAGEDLAGFAYGDFYASPHPDVKMKNLGMLWHWGKVLFEKWWLSPIGFNKSLYKSLLQLGGKSMNIHIRL